MSTDVLDNENLDLWAFLDRDKVRDVLARSNEPFRKDVEYLETILPYYRCIQLRRETKNRIISKYVEANEDDTALEKVRERLSHLESVAQKLQASIRKRIERSVDASTKPRMLRLADRLGLSDTERQIFEYVVLCNTSSSLSVGHLAGDVELHDVATLFSLPATEVLALTNPNLPLYTDGLLTVEEPGIISSGLRRDLEIRFEVLKAIWGLDLTEDEFLDLEDTALGNIITEEPTFAPPFGLDYVDDDDAGLDQEPDKDDLAESFSSEEEEPIESIDIESLLASLDDEELPSPQPSGDPSLEDDSTPGELGPYTSNHEYLQDNFERLEKHIELKNLDHEHSLVLNDDNPDAKRRRLNAACNRLRRRCNHRLEATREAGDWLPRLERLVEARNLDSTERDVLLTLVASHVMGDAFSDRITARELLFLFSDGLSERVKNRKYFYKNARLVDDGLIDIDSSFGRLDSASVTLDPQMLHFLLGLEAESGQLVEGSQMYWPDVDLDRVILPADQKQRILETALNYESFREARSRLGFDDLISYGRGLVLLFYGPSGTGKTMMANALANEMDRRVLLVNFPSLGFDSDAALRLLFREARIHNAVLFFDECESIFGNRDSLLLTELERHDGLVILATNRPQQLDEAMHRRIALAEPFHKPDTILREQIWQTHIPEAAQAGDGVNFQYLAQRYELTGGLIKNAVLSALAKAVSREPTEPTLTHDDLERGARSQLKGHLQMAEFERKVTPKVGLDAMVLKPDLEKRLRELVELERSSRVLFTQWGFNKDDVNFSRGTVALFFGPPGTGKTMAAEAVGFELGRPIRLVRPAEVLSAYVGQTPKRLEAIFEEAAAKDAIIFFDEADGLFSSRTSTRNSTDRYANVDVGVLLHLIESFDGIAILTSNLEENIDSAFRRRIQYALEFERPDKSLRFELWSRMIPDKLPMASSVDLEQLAQRFELTGAGIRNVIQRAAAHVASRSEGNRVVKMDDFIAAACDEVAWDGKSKRIGFSRG